MIAKEIRIFVSSPGDVAEERDCTRAVVVGLEKQYPGVTLTPVLWEELALPATASFQEGIDCILGKQPIDVAVFILWSRLGTPVKLAGKEYGSGTKREFDLILAAFEQSGRKRPLILAYTRRDDVSFKQKLVDAPKASLQEIVRQLELAEQFIKEHFKDAEGRNLRAYHSYPKPIDFAQRLRVHLRQALDDLLGADAAPRWHEEPYRALERFDVEHAVIFHGRDEETCDLLERLRDQQRAGVAFVVLVGASGLGKSSLARAGVAASLLQYPGDEGVKKWRPVFFTPEDEADDLLLGLTRSLAAVVRELNDTSTALADVSDGLQRDAPLTVRLSISAALARAAEQAGGPVRVLLVIDQMEELWTDRRITTNDRQTFLDAIEALAGSGQVAVLATLRSDFYGHAQQLPAFVRLKGERGQFDLLPPDAAALQRLIVEPARQAGLQFERNEQTGRTLDEVVLEDALGDPSSLPLLEYALSELYRQCQSAVETTSDDNQAVVSRRLLTFAAYEAMGGVEGSLAKRATEIFEALPAEAQAALDEILPLLVTVDAMGDQAAVRRRAPLAELEATPARRALTEQLVAARFLTTDRSEIAIASLAHEALLRDWQRVADWISKNREHLWLRARVEQSQQRWEQQSRDESLLLPTGLPLEEGRQLLHDARRLLGANTIQYIALSIARDERRVAQRRRKTLAVTSALSALTIAAAFAALRAWSLRQEAVAEKQHAEALVGEASRSDFATAQARLAEGKWQEGVAYLARSLRYNPQNADARDAFLLVALYGVRDGGRMPRFEVHHKDAVLSARFSPDGTRIVTASEDRTAQVWDAATGERIGKPLRHTGGVRRVSFSPDGTRIVTAGYDWAANVWDAATGEPICGPLIHERAATDATSAKVRPEHVDVPRPRERSARAKRFFEHPEVTSASFSPDGARIVTASRTTARVWNAATGEPIGKPIQHEAALTAASFSPDGTQIVTASYDNTARIWDAATGKPIGKLLRHMFPVLHASFSPDGTSILTASSHAAHVWDAATFTPIGKPIQHEAAITAASFSPDGTQIVTASDDKTARVCDAVTGQPVGQPLRHQNGVSAASFSADGTRIVTASDDRTARVWDATTGQPIGEPLRHDDKVIDASFSADGARIITASDDKAARVWDPVTGQASGELLRHDDKVIDASFSADGERIVTASDDRTARVWDAASGQPIGEPLRHDDKVIDASFSPDGTRIVTASSDKTARVWNAATGQPIGEPLRHDDRVFDASFSADGERIVTASSDKTARVWNAATGEPIGVPLWHNHAVLRARFSRDGTKIVVFGMDYDPDLTPWEGLGQAATVREWAKEFAPKVRRWGKVWDAATGLESYEPLRNEDQIRSNLLSVDGTRIAHIRENAAQVWDAATAQPIGQPLRHEHEVNHASFSPDGKRIVTASADKTARVWECKPTRILDPSLAPQVASFLAGAHLDSQTGTLKLLSYHERLELWKELTPALADSPEWLFVARTAFPRPSDSPVSPRSSMTIREAASRLIRTGQAGCLQEALSIDPGHPLIQIAFAALEDKTPARAAFLREYGIAHLPNDAAVCREAADMLLTQRDQPRAARALDKAAKLDPEDRDLIRLREAVQKLGNSSTTDAADAPPQGTR